MSLRVRAPGRVNLLGEHTDYTGGCVLPLAIDRYIDITITPRHDGVIRLDAPQVEGTLELPAERPVRRAETWANYILGVVAELWPRGNFRRGFDLAVTGDLPMGAGLASSAALTVGTAYALSALYELGIQDLDLVRAAQRAEHRFVGVQCGIMDQAASALSRRGHALLLDCGTLDMRPVPFADALVAVCQTGVRHELATSEYNRRVAECREAVRLREEGRALPDGLARRWKHVVTENARVTRGAALLESGDLDGFGELMFESHASLRDLYEVSCPELDAIVESARGVALGAKMTGAGFGGAVVCLVRPDRAGELEDRVGGAVTLCRSADGARETLSAGRIR